MKKIKREIGFIIGKTIGESSIYDVFVKMNAIIFHWDRRRRIVHKNKKISEKYYIIRSRGNTEGLLSSYFFVLENVCWAYKNGYIPYVDFEDQECQYYKPSKVINNTNNPWEWFFMPVSAITKDELKEKKNILLSGWSIKIGREKEKEENPEISLSELKSLSKKISVQPYIRKMAEDIWNEKFAGKKTLGVFIRGTDYVALKPKGHYIQPTIEQMERKINEFMNIYKFDQIYLVTEDYEYFKYMKLKFADKIITADHDFVMNYQGNDFVSESFKDDPYDRAVKYLIRLLLLSMCEYVISSKASGAEFADVIREKEYTDIYWFDLGKY